MQIVCAGITSPILNPHPTQPASIPGVNAQHLDAKVFVAKTMSLEPELMVN